MPTMTHTVAAVTAASGVALTANASRNYILLVNDSDTVMYIKVGATAVANQGIRLNANGGNYEMAGEFGNFQFDAINAIHGGSGSKALLVTERT